MNIVRMFDWKKLLGIIKSFDWTLLFPSCAAFCSAFFLWMTYEADLISWIGEKICPWLDWQPSLWAMAACVLYWLWIVSICYKRWKHVHVLSIKHITLIITLLLILIRCRRAELFEFSYVCGKLTYVDAIILPCAWFVIEHCINYLRRFKPKSNNICNILDDEPIETEDDDAFDYIVDARRYAAKIQTLPMDIRGWSVAVTSPWGGGKTSMIKLIKMELKDTFISIDFNPRHSASKEQIQQDFFSTMLSVLKHYDAGMKPLLNDYVRTISVVDQSGIANMWMDKLQKVSNKGTRTKVEQAIIDLPKPVLVTFEDFDRLTAEEMLEVLKIIDSTAAFKNVVFMSAYDQEYVSRLMAEQNTENGNYADKYFPVEFSVPIRPYQYMCEYLANCVLKVMPDIMEKDALLKFLENQSDLLSQIIKTPRDAKRFTNLFAKDYEIVRDEVVFWEFFLVRLIKFRYPDEYQKFSQKQYLDNYSGGKSELLERKGNADLADVKSLDIIDRLLPTQSGAGDRHLFRSIRSVDSFDNYFCDGVYNSLSLRELRLCTSIVNITEYKNWMNDEDSRQDFIKYIQYEWLPDKISSVDELMHRIRAMIQFYNANQQEAIAKRLSRTISYAAIKALQQKFSIDLDVLQRYVLQQLNLMDVLPGLDLMNILIVNIVANKQQNKPKDDAFIAVGYLQDKRYEMFQKYLDSIRSVDEPALSQLAKCIIENGRLCPNCCNALKLKICKNPDDYVRSFVKAMTIYSPENPDTIGCDPLWKSIWGDASGLHEFLFESQYDSNENFLCARNFYRLFEANEFEYLDFHETGKVQDRIREKLMHEAEMLDFILENEKVIDYMKGRQPQDISECSEWRGLLKQISKTINDFQLVLKKKESVLTQIGLLDRNLQSYTQVNVF